MRVIFAGTPDFAARHLQALLNDKQFEVVAAYTQPDRPAGRGKKLQPSAVKVTALEHDIPVEQPVSLKTPEAQQTLQSYQADIMVVVAYGLILPQAVLDIPRLGCINVHGSILPKWRGAAPIQRAIWAGDQETGITIMQMNAGLDTGPMLHVEKTPIAADETSASLYEKLAETGPVALVETLKQIQQGQVHAQEQDDSQATYAKKLSKEEARIDWSLPAAVVERYMRAYTPWPGSEFLRAGERVKVLHAEPIESDNSQAPGTIIKADKHGLVVQCEGSALKLVQVQLPGKKPMAIHELLNARKDNFKVGDSLLNEAPLSDNE
ncbi:MULTISPECIES: methionyl-tRNA formyltransferase [Gammaproteobacteria]|uniref:methionyl-tRNA formyltransferase n=1 Tax=Gammaproteobacteria TaxID=1236 RepID=UPI000DD09DC0|nr:MULTISPECIES: methionyl-tRNA formyltransferase [Gammaproteobacteria]RTE86669.1 methionyl-tRNA formyltransferase [Aliidiomarina sp. B3213]TCZ90778.1 methionyl-tRNA formyltransferase [Lysobacter sp. N42]